MFTTERKHDAVSVRIKPVQKLAGLGLYTGSQYPTSEILSSGNGIDCTVFVNKLQLAYCRVCSPYRQRCLGIC
jgi:hypothetical protein